MKILIIANSIVGDEPGVTGGESRFIELAKSWRKKGYEIHLMSSKGGKVLCEKMGLPVILHSISNSSSTGRLEIITRIFKMLFHLPTLLVSFKEGIVYSGSEQIYDVFPGFMLKLLRPSKIRFGVVTHWLPPVCFRERKNSKFLFSLLFLISERLGLFFAGFNADVLLPVSEDTLSSLKNSIFNRRPAYFVLCGVNPEEIDSYFPEKEQKIYDAVFMKRLQRTKGVLDLVEMWAELVKRKPGAKLLIIGEGIDGEEARKLSVSLGMEKNIEFAGVIYDPQKKFKLLGQSKVFVLPSYEENWAIVIGEAMAVGIPVVCYDLKELRPVWENNVIYAKIGDKSDLLEKVAYLLENGSERAKMAQKAREFVKKYSWEKIADTELSLILGTNP
ncbi:MAG: Glycosyltransferase, family 4 [candidate division WWE3 bacterium GW2011_GWD2_42_11]|nr:MAG: Glycosyltransferase, family 4 [candidate division WWE3 bacterium GW2011_GWD2_42_11]